MPVLNLINIPNQPILPIQPKNNIPSTRIYFAIFVPLLGILIVGLLNYGILLFCVFSCLSYCKYITNPIDLDMDHTIPAKLQIISLELAEKSDDDFLCSISLMKGMQNFGQIKFQIDKEYTEYAFTEQKFIKFSFTPRLASRKDVFFRIILTDLESNEQMGDIPVSTHMLADAFKDDKVVIEDRKEFFQGVALTYKIHQTLLEVGSVGQKQSGFHKQHQENDFLSKIFSRPEFDEDQLLESTIKKSRKNSFYQAKTQPVPQPKKQQTMPLLPFMKTIEQQPTDINNQLTININPPPTPNIFNLLVPSKQQNPMKTSQTQVHSSQLINRIFGLVRQQQFQDQKKRHTLSQKKTTHHDSQHKLSKKLKMVIFLLIFGFLMTILDVYQDKQQRRIIRKKLLKSSQTKKKAV